MQIQKKYDWVKRIPEILIYIFAAECTLGASGRWLSVGPLSIRMIIFIFCFIASLPLVLTRFKEIIKKPIIIATIVFGFMILITAINGYLNGNKFSFIVSDITGILTLALLPGIIAVIDTKQKRDKFLNVIFYSASAVGIITVILYIALHFMTDLQIMNTNIVINSMSLGGFTQITSDSFRVYFRSQIFMQFASIYGVYKICTTSSKRKYVYALLVGLMFTATIISLTRGFWVGLAISAVLFVILQIKNIKNLLKAAGMILVVFVLTISVITLCYGKPYLVADFVNRFNPNLIVLSGSDTSIELENTSPELNEISTADKEAVSIRAQTITLLFKEFRNSPLLGEGLGTNLDEIRDDGKTEYMYLDYLAKMGIIGLISFMAVYFLPCLQYAKKRIFHVRKKESLSDDIIRNDCIISAYLGIAITSYFNPFLNSPMGILMLFTVIISNSISDKKTES